MAKYFFTFGMNHKDAEGNSLGCNYVEIDAVTEAAARAEMIKHRGPKWAFSYTEEQFDGQPEAYGLKPKLLCEVEIPDIQRQAPFGV